MWGIDHADPVDRTGIDMQDDDTMPIVHFDASFVVDDALQLEVIQVCEAAYDARELVAAKDENTKGEGYCVMELFRDYMNHTGRAFPTGGSGGGADRFFDYVTEPGFEAYVVDERKMKGYALSFLLFTCFFLESSNVYYYVGTPP